jgi:pimeloyl-ACP methyl ester carboxylesterase
MSQGDAPMSETGSVAVSGTTLYYQVAGKGEPVILLHAGIADRRMWKDQIEALAPYFRVLAYDLRGYGESPIPPGPFSHEADLLALMDALGIARAILVGASMGGRTAINVTLDHPDRVRALALVNAAISGFEFSDPAFMDQGRVIDAAILSGDYEGAADLEIQLWIAGPHRTLDQIDPALRTLMQDMLIPTYEHADVGEELPFDPPAIGRLNEIHVPTLVVVGDYDVPDIIERSTILARDIAGARKVKMHGVAHLPNLEQPEAFNSILLEFLRSL